MTKEQLFEWIHSGLVVTAGLVLALGLSGCAAPAGEPIIQKVAIPVRCLAEVPQEPVLACRHTPSEPDATFLDRFVANCTSDAELRDGYEAKLLAALLSCK